MKSWLKRNKIFIAAIAAAICVICGSISLTGNWDDIYTAVRFINKADKGEFVRFADVGQGDCTIVQSEGRAMLIDTGDESHAAQLCTYLRSLGIHRLDCVLVTHPHSDHMGALNYIYANMDVQRVYISDIPPSQVRDRKLYDQILSGFDGEILPIDSFSDVNFGKFLARVVYFDSTAYDENDCSAVVNLICGGYSFLVTGDITEYAEQKINVDADVLKVAHHGSKYSSSLGFLERVSPSFAVISVGSDNSYGHPDKTVLERLSQVGATIRRTDVNGAITFQIEDGLKLYTEY